MSTTKKPRKKKYNGQQFIKQKVHKFQMFWEVLEAERIIDLHHLLNGSDVDDETFTPVDVWMKAHKGDLALALKSHSIPPLQSFHIVSKIHAFHPETGEEFNGEFQLATATPMQILDFLDCKSENIYVDDGGFSKKWKGFENELLKFMTSTAPGFEIKTNHCCLTCFSTFKTFAHEREFKALKLIHGLGLGVTA